MLSRRSLTALLTGLPLPSLVVEKGAKAQAASRGETYFVGCFKDFKTFNIPESADHVVTSGYWREGIGAADYVSTGPGPFSPYRAVSANGRWFELTGPELFVEKFGAIGNDPGVDDFPAIQAAIDFNERRGGGTVRCEGEKTYYLSQTVTIDPTLTSIDAEGATWNFARKAFQDPATLPNLLSNGDFAEAGAHWLLGSRGDAAKWRFVKGGALYEPGDGTHQKEGAFGQRLLSVVSGERLLVTASVDALADEGSLFIGLCDGAGGLRENGIGFGRESGRTFDARGQYQFKLRVPEELPNGAIWFEIKANAPARVSDLNVVPAPNNACVMVSVKAGSPQYGNARRYCRGLRVVGRASRPYLADGMLFDTKFGARSSRWALYSCELAVNLGHGLVLGDRAYLLQAYSSAFSGETACIETLPSSFDAGESIDFFGCTFGNGGVGIKNSGDMELKLYGGSIDYCRQFFAGGGQVTLFGTHLEMAQPSAPKQYPIEVTGGDFKMKGGTLLATLSGANDYMFYGANRFSRIHLQDVDGYGWPAAKGQLMGGKGRLLIDRVWWGANHQIVSIVKRDSLHSVFGAGGQFEGPSLAIGCAVTCPSGTNRGPHKTHFIGGGAESYANLSLSREQAHSGMQSLKFMKHRWGGGTGTSLLLFAPIERRRMISCEFWYICPKVPGAHGSGTFWIGLAFAQIIGFDAERVPIIAQTAGCQEAAVHLDYEHGIPDWTHMQLGSTYADVTSATDGYGPDWTTHMLISINSVNMPGGFVLYIDDLYGFVF